MKKKSSEVTYILIILLLAVVITAVKYSLESKPSADTPTPTDSKPRYAPMKAR